MLSPRCNSTLVSLLRPPTIVTRAVSSAGTSGVMKSHTALWTSSRCAASAPATTVVTVFSASRRQLPSSVSRESASPDESSGAKYASIIISTISDDFVADVFVTAISMSSAQDTSLLSLISATSLSSSIVSSAPSARRTVAVITIRSGRSQSPAASSRTSSSVLVSFPSTIRVSIPRMRGSRSYQP